MKEARHAAAVGVRLAVVIASVLGLSILLSRTQLVQVYTGDRALLQVCLACSLSRQCGQTCQGPDSLVPELHAVRGTSGRALGVPRQATQGAKVAGWCRGCLVMAWSLAGLLPAPPRCPVHSPSWGS